MHAQKDDSKYIFFSGLYWRGYFIVWYFSINKLLQNYEEGTAALIHFMEECKRLLPTNCPLSVIVRIILDFILKHSTFRFMDMHMHQTLGTSIGTRMAPFYANLFMGKEERTIILTFLHLIYFWKSFIDDIFFIFLGSHSQLKSLMTFMNTISPTIKYTFTYSKQTHFPGSANISFWDQKT